MGDSCNYKDSGISGDERIVSKFNIDQASYEALEKAVLRNNPAAKTEVIRKAYELSKRVHQGQKRDEGTPYFLHPYRVALYLAEEVKEGNEKTIAAALLHDALEDCPELTYKDLVREFGVDIAVCVNLLTKPEVTDKRTKTARDILYHDRLLQAPKNAIMIKIADRLDNVRHLHLCPDPVKRKRYKSETKAVYLPLARKYYPPAADEMEVHLKCI